MMLEKRLFLSQRLQAKYLTPSLNRLALGERNGPPGSEYDEEDARERPPEDGLAPGNPGR